MKEDKKEVETICSSCGRLLEDDPSKTFLLCKVCNWFIPRGSHSYVGRRKKSLKGGKYERKMVNKKNDKPKKKVLNPDRSLFCDKCKKIKRAGKKRVTKWKGKKYLCRECRPSKKKKAAKS